jgi:hypothetical protein
MTTRQHDATISGPSAAGEQPAGQVRFRTTIVQSGKSITGIEVPADVVARLGTGKRMPVRVRINGFTYRGSIAVMGGKFMISLSAENRKNAGVAGGDEVEVDLELDTAPREVTVPADLAAALARDPVAKRVFEALSYSRKQVHTLSVDSAKTDETRARRVAKAIEALRAEAVG